MEQWQVIMLLLAGFALLVTAVILRARFGEKYELKTIDLVLIIVPLLLVLLITGRVKMLDAFGVKADFSKLFTDAAEDTIKPQTALISTPDLSGEINLLSMETKQGVGKIPELVENQIEALVFQLGHGGYYGPAIKQYIDALQASSYLQYIIVLDQQEKLFGIYEVPDLLIYFRINPNDPYSKIAGWLNRPDERALNELRRLPGFIDARLSVQRKQSKRAVLTRMDSLRVNSLPVVDENRRFVGTIERSELTASLILEVVNRLEGKK